MKRYFLIIGMSAIFIFGAYAWADSPSGYEGIFAGTSMSFSSLNANLSTDVNATNVPSLGYTSQASAVGSINAGMMANVFQSSNAPSDFFSTFWQNNQNNQPFVNIISYSNQVSANGIIDNFHVGFHYQSLYTSPSPQFSFSQIP
ncbi:MAG: hypothetical protein U9R17_14040 [Thermodesulfobacteriota bacterium]|nr:hypothetical protein [Thermodesulfobacteriota bacterium]